MKRKDYLREFIIWSPSGDPEVPYKTRHNGVSLSLRLNDFPAEHLYTLDAGGSMVHFDDWPKAWKKSRARKKSASATSTARTNTTGYAKITAKITKSKDLRKA